MSNLLNYYIKIIKEKNITFIVANIISLFVIFYLLDGPNDSFLYRVLYYIIALFLGGWIAFKFVSSSQDTEPIILKKIRNGSIISLVLITTSIYFRTNETAEVSGSPDSSSSSTNSSNNGGGSSSDCVTCYWCGGRGEVGYAGESEAQVRRTGVGLGNQCMTCDGDGCE